MARVVDLHRPSGQEERPELYRLELKATAQGRTTALFGGDFFDPSENDFNRIQVLGGSEIGGDDRTEVFVQIGTGASDAFLAVFRLWNSRLVRVTLDGSPLEISSGGSVGDLARYECTRTTLTLWGADEVDDWKAYLESTDRYRLAGTALVLVSHRSTQVREPSNAVTGGCPGVHMVFG